MKSKYFVPLVTGTAIALLGVWAVSSTRVRVAESAIQCVQDLKHPLIGNEEEVHLLHGCEVDAKKVGARLWDATALFALFGWIAGALGYVAGERGRDQWWQRRLQHREKSQAAGKAGGASGSHG